MKIADQTKVAPYPPGRCDICSEDDLAFQFINIRWSSPTMRMSLYLRCVTREDEVASLGLIVAGEAAFH